MSSSSPVIPRLTVAKNHLRLAVQAQDQGRWKDAILNYHEALRLYKLEMGVQTNKTVVEKLNSIHTQYSLVLQRCSDEYTKSGRTETKEASRTHSKESSSASYLNGSRSNGPDPTASSTSSSGPHSSSSSSSSSATSLPTNDEIAQIVASCVLDQRKINPPVRWEDIVGQEEIVTRFKTQVIPFLSDSHYSKNTKRWREKNFKIKGMGNILFYGASGSGKSIFARAAACALPQVTFFNVSPDIINSKWRGESEKIVHELFKQAKERAPSLVFIDEAESILKKKSVADGDSNSAGENTVNVFLQCLDGVGSSVQSETPILVIIMTNRPDKFDDAFYRRFPTRLHVSLPDFDGRVKLFQYQLRQMDEHSLNLDEIRALAKATEWFSPSDINAFFEEVKKQIWTWTENGTSFLKTDDHTYRPCGSTHPGALSITLDQLQATEDADMLDIRPPVITYSILKPFLDDFPHPASHESLSYKASLKFYQQEHGNEIKKRHTPSPPAIVTSLPKEQEGSTVASPADFHNDLLYMVPTNSPTTPTTPLMYTPILRPSVGRSIPEEAALNLSKLDLDSKEEEETGSSSIQSNSNDHDPTSTPDE